MISSFLQTKFYIPPWRTDSVARARLVESLSEGLDRCRKLTLLSAPAGYGKTTLLAEWIHALQSRRAPQVRIACLSLDQGDNDPARFINYFVSALRTADETLGQTVVSLLGSPQLPPLSAIFDELINEIAAVPYQIILVLDDYHVINNSNLHEALEYLIEHQPPCFHLVIATREDPSLPLARFRVRGEMSEVRAHDLRFTIDEAHRFFGQAVKLTLKAGTVEALEAKTEGWPAGLQLAALAMQNLQDEQDFLADFSGSHRYIIDYLLDEVLKSQPAEIASFLARTAVLKRFNAELCEAVTHNAASAAILAELERRNLFLVPLDSQRGWYRYHPLFAEVLHAGLSADAERQTQIDAAHWLESHGLYAEAVPYWLSVKNIEAAKHLIGDLAVELLKRGELQTLLGWLDALPAEDVDRDPNLVSYKALSLLMTGQINQAREYVTRTDQGFDSQTLGAGHGRFLSMQAWFAMTAGEARTGELAQAALGQLEASDTFFRILTLIALGNYFAWNAELAASSSVFAEAYALGKQLNHPFISLGALANLAFNLLDQGELRRAEALCRSALTEYVDSRGSRLPILGMIYMPLASICYEKGDFDEAQSFAQTGSELCERLFSSSIMGKDNQVVMARIAMQRGNAGQALELLRCTAEDARQHNMMMVVYKMTLVRAEVYLMQGNLAQAQMAISELDALGQSSLPKAEHVAAHLHARYLAACGKPEAALEILSRLEKVDRDEGSVRRLIGVRVTKALILERQSKPALARSTFESALKMAAAEGYKVAFVPDDARDTRALLRAARAAAPDFVDSILRAIEPDGEPCVSLPDPLSEQEMKVLNLIEAGKSNQEIAEELVISVGTAKWHVHNILQKLGAKNRTQAIATATELGLK